MSEGRNFARQPKVDTGDRKVQSQRVRQFTLTL